MNKFDELFFSQFIPAGSVIKAIVHEHFIVILDKVLIWLILGAYLPAFFYNKSALVNAKSIDIIGFSIGYVYLFEALTIGVLVKIMYDIFDRYNDVWIITDVGVIDLDWQLFDTTLTSIKFENIEGVEIKQEGVINSILGKGDIYIHKIGTDSFVIEDAFVPYEAMNEINTAIKANKKKHDKKEDQYSSGLKTDILTKALGNIVREYMEKHELKEKKYEENLDKIKKEKNTLDLTK